MNEPGSEKKIFGMAFPFNHCELISKIKVQTDKLGILIFLVSNEEVKPL